MVDSGVNGFVLPVGEIDRLCEDILTVVSNPELRESMSRAAVEKVASSFTWTRYADRVMSEIQQWCGAGDRAS